MEVFADIESWQLSVFLRKSVWAYPLVNTLHLLGVALLMGGVAALDLRILGVWRRVAQADVARVAVSLASAGFLLAVVAGPLLFVVQAKTYAVVWLFWLKMALLLLAVLNAGLVVRSGAWRRFAGADQERASTNLKLAAVASLLLWLGVMATGRLVGYA